MAAILSFVVALSIYLLPAFPVGDITGVASVIDGDTFETRGERIRLHGIDAPESAQRCRGGEGSKSKSKSTSTNSKMWRCGQQAALALDQLVSGKTVGCVIKDTDRYGRKVCECFLSNTNTNINAWLVENGWALAYRQYSTDYVEQEATAKAAGAGIWSSEFVNPAQYRRGERLSDNTTSTEADKYSEDCPIKGNINSKGDKIYHVASGRYYAQTKIDTSKGERWFCSEQQARASGWRASKR